MSSTSSGHGKVFASAFCLLSVAGNPLPAAAFTVPNISNSGPGSLRQAILDANTSPGADTIDFNIPGSGVHTIGPLSPLPASFEVVVSVWNGQSVRYDGRDGSGG
jgi:hypothetical protein